MSVLLTSPPLRAQLLAPEPAAPPSEPVSAAELPPKNEDSQLVTPFNNTKHVHDGFFLRFTFGFAALQANVEPGFAGAADRNLSNVGPAWSFEVGATPARGLVVGALYYGSVSSSVFRYRSKSHSTTSDYRLHALGGLLTWFPNTRKGFELGATIMWAPLQVTLQNYSDGRLTTNQTFLSGVSPGLSAGYTGWISANWAMGGLVRVAVGSHASDEARATSFASMLLLNILYH